MIDADDNNDGYVDRKEGEVASKEIESGVSQELEREKMQQELGLKKEELNEKKRANKADEAIKRTAANKKPSNG